MSHVGASGAAASGVVASGGPAASWASFARTLVTLVSSAVVGVGQAYAVIPLLPAIAGDFGTSTSAATWMVTAFSLSFAVSFLAAGPLADRFGPRRVILSGLAAVAVTTVAVPLASSLATGVALRCVQGAAAAMLVPTGFAYVTSQLDPARRPVAFSALSSAGLASAVVLQVVAQALAPLGWRTVFLVSGAALGVVLVVAVRLLRPDDHGSASRADSVFAAVAAVPRLLARPRLLGLYLATAALLGGFVVVYTAIELAGPAAVDSTGAMLALRASALPAVIAAPVLTRLTASLPLRLRATGFLGSAAVAALALPVAAGDVVALAAVLLVFVGAIALASPAVVGLIHARAGGAIGASTALYSASLFLGASVGPQVVAALDEFTPTLLATAGILAAATVLVWVSTRGD
ncbi:putative arabinose efflux permease, MFS family [Prauserella alba]|nr:putative arabinose efflux permease, MFS family [Prauserella alba]